jgi:thiol-disulfide isomerase/thioredoxin
MGGREAVALFVASAVCGCAGAAAGPPPAEQAPVAAVPSPPAAPIAERVAKALVLVSDEGTHWHRTDALVALGPDAVPELRAVVLDRERGDETRGFAARALGRIGGRDAAAALHDALAGEATSTDLRKTCEEALFLLGETGPVDRRIETARARHADIAVARSGAAAQVAQTLYATGRFREAADAWRALATAETDPDRAGRLAYDWTCCAALAGAKDEAVAAAEVALRSARTDLDWMSKDGDLRAIRDDARFAKLLADARAKKPAAPSAPDPARGLPGFDEYRELHHGYWDVAFERWIAAQNAYWEGFESWLAAEKKTRSDETAAEFVRLRGPEPAKPTDEWVARFRELLARHREDAIGAKIRENLLTIFQNERMADDWVALYTESMETPNQESVVGEQARSVDWMQSQSKNGTNLKAQLRAWLAKHPDGEPASQVRQALADDLREEGDAAAARAAYEEIVRLHPGTWSAKEAAGALYEMENLAVGMTAPDFAATDLRGAPVSLKSLRGRVVLLDFWATWCGPCIGEVPHMVELNGRFKGDDFALVGVSLDGDGLALADFLDERKMTWPEVCDLREFDGAVPTLYHVRGVPDTVLIDREGRIVARGLRGEDLVHAVEKALAPAR